MKAKNTFKRPNITYEPIQQKKQPFWMHSIDKPTQGDTKDAVWSAIMIIFIIASVYLSLHMYYNG